MHGIRDLISNTPHVARIVFGTQMTHVQHNPHREEKRMHYYVGAASGDRFLLMEIPSPGVANGPVDLLPPEEHLGQPVWRHTINARTSDTDYHFHHPMIVPRPRATIGSPQDNAIRIRTHELRQCLRFGLFEIEPGSVRWEGDRFKAEYAEEYKKAIGPQRVRVGMFGENVPESVKEKVLENLLNPPPATESRPGGFTLTYTKVVQEHLPLPVPEPEPGSIEAKIADVYWARHEARMARGISGELKRDAEGRVTQICFDKETGIHWRTDLEYTAGGGTPSPYPKNIKRFLEKRDLEDSEPHNLFVIYDLQLSDVPLDDAAFVPWPYLKKSSYFVGKPHGENGWTLADPNDRVRWREIMRRQDENGR